MQYITKPTCPPAAHAVTSAKRPPSLISRLAAVVTRRTPVAPNGWPIDREPPQVLSFSSGKTPNYTPVSSADWKHLLSTRRWDLDAPVSMWEDCRDLDLWPPEFNRVISILCQFIWDRSSSLWDIMVTKSDRTNKRFQQDSLIKYNAFANSVGWWTHDNFKV